jgi:UDP-N-acetyl-alpha-D-muramoyl-L-alanyl-L-glutamate epimerase
VLFWVVRAYSAIFGENMFLRARIRRHMLDLVLGAVRPWECVGTRDECLAALDMVLQADPKWDFKEFPRRSDFVAMLAKLLLASMRKNVLARASSEHLIPTEVLAALNLGIASFRTSGVQIPQSSIPSHTR